MKVNEKLSFDAYYEDARFRRKIPSQGLIAERGDNIYHKKKIEDAVRTFPITKNKVWITI